MTEFEQIYQAYFRDVYLYARKLTGDARIAEDITSETFVKALQAIDSFRGTRLLGNHIDHVAYLRWWIAAGFLSVPQVSIAPADRVLSVSCRPVMPPC